MTRPSVGGGQGNKTPQTRKQYSKQVLENVKSATPAGSPSTYIKANTAQEGARLSPCCALNTYG
jgi:hypothetical protein